MPKKGAIRECNRQRVQYAQEYSRKAAEQDPSLAEYQVYRSPLPADGRFDARGPAGTVQVVNQDTLVAGRELLDSGHRPVCLNMASQFKPGGGYQAGAMAQEESLFYRTTYCASLERAKACYPLKDKVIYSPKVEVIRDEEYNLLKRRERFIVSMIACAAWRKPKWDEAKYQSSKQRLLRVLHTAHAEGHDSVVLGAWGCGAYGNPPGEIARAFYEALYDYRWVFAFRTLVFAILPGRLMDSRAVFTQILTPLKVPRSLAAPGGEPGTEARDP